MRRMSRLAALGLLLCAAPAPAQDPADRVATVTGFDLPDEVAQEVVAAFNDPRRVQHRGPVRVEAGDTVEADLAVLEGPLDVAGVVRGGIVVINGDVRLREGAVVTGDVLVVGGHVEGAEAARVGGALAAYDEELPFREEGGRIRLTARPEPEPDAGRADFLVTTGRSYNRVEGLPVSFGPRVQTAGRNPFRVHALGVYRTESGWTLDTERMGYSVVAEQFLGGRRALRAGLSAFSLVDPIEDWHLSDLENGLATFLLHRDFRDYYEREGVGAHLTLEPREGSYGVTLEGRWERHRAVPPGNPWSLVDNAEPWRPQPLAAEGDLASLEAEGWIDTRSSAVDPATGWLVRGRLERGFSDLSRPAAFQEQLVDGVVGLASTGGGAVDDFTVGLIDVRRYNRVNPESRLNFRFVGAGSLGGGALPPQRQFALGGEGSLPGFGLFSRDCGARSGPVLVRPGTPEEARFFTDYGCDAIALLQAELRGRMNLGFGWGGDVWDEEGGWSFLWDIAPEWAFFVDAGRAWAFGGGRADEEIAVDAGIGILFDRLGLYVATPLSGGGNGLNLFVRLGPRF